MDVNMPVLMEKAVIAALLCRPESLLEIVDRLRPEMFSHPDLGFVYAAILSLYEKGKEIDMLTVEGEMLRFDAEVYQRLNGLSFLSDMLESVRTDQHISVHAAEIVHYYVLRTLGLRLQKIQLAIREPDADEQELLNELSATIEEMHHETLLSDTIEPAADVALRVLEQSYGEQAARENGLSHHIFTGLKDLDELTGGLFPGELTVLPARPSMGKTSVALWIALSVARKGHPVSFFSLEMSKEELVGRLLSILSGVNSDRLRFKGTDAHDRELLEKARAELDTLPFTLEYCGPDTVDEIRAKAHRLHRQGKLGILFIDYLNLINMVPSRKQLEDTTDLAMGNVARKVKLLAEELAIPVVLLAQMNRDSDKRPAPHYPVLSDLRNSGAIEQVADKVVFVYRFDKYNIFYDPKTKEDLRGVGLLLVAKNRNGATGIARFRFNASMTLLANYDNQLL